MPKRQPLYPHVPKSKVERLPQISLDGKEPMSLALTREQVTETILRNLLQAGILLQKETTRYRATLESYDNISLLKVLIHSHELREAGNA